jgi:hypothetical protein
MQFSWCSEMQFNSLRMAIVQSARSFPLEWIHRCTCKISSHAIVAQFKEHQQMKQTRLSTFICYTLSARSHPGNLRFPSVNADDGRCKVLAHQRNYNCVQEYLQGKAIPKWYDKYVEPDIKSLEYQHYPGPCEGFPIKQSDGVSHQVLQ